MVLNDINPACGSKERKIYAMEFQRNQKTGLKFTFQNLPWPGSGYQSMSLGKQKRELLRLQKAANYDAIPLITSFTSIKLLDSYRTKMGDIDIKA